MKTRLTLKPGQKGTKKLLRQYGDKLVCVRYQYDEVTHKRYKTVELIVEEVTWPPKSPLDDVEKVVGVKVYWGEIELGKRVRNAGGTWDARRKVWLLPYGAAEQLGLTDRIVEIRKHIHTDTTGSKSI